MTRTKTWSKDFKRRAEKIPRNRQPESVRLLRALIKDMHLAEFSEAEMGRLLEKDRTTIIHHLYYMGFRPRDEIAARKVEDYKERVERERQITEKVLQYETHRKELARLKTKRSLIYKKRQDEAAEENKLALKLYKQGVPVEEIARKVNRPIGSIGYLIFHKGQIPRRRPTIRVQKMDLAGKVLTTYPSIRAASLDTGLTMDMIRHGIDDKRYFQSGGFRWRRLTH
jgi:hypothetical protein